MENKPKSSTLKLRVKQVFQLTIESGEEYSQYFFDGRLVSRIRLTGIIVSKYDKFDGNKFQSCFLTLDDGSQTISLRTWMNENYQDSGLVSQLQNIRIGDICEVSGRVREYEGERYLLLESVSSPKSIDWEIKQRLLLVKQERESNEFGSKVGRETLELLEYFEQNYELNTPHLLAKRSQIDLEQIERHLEILYNEALIICPLEGYYKIVV